MKSAFGIGYFSAPVSVAATSKDTDQKQPESGFSFGSASGATSKDRDQNEPRSGFSFGSASGATSKDRDQNEPRSGFLFGSASAATSKDADQKQLGSGLSFGSASVQELYNLAAATSKDTGQKQPGSGFSFDEQSISRPISRPSRPQRITNRQENRKTATSQLELISKELKNASRFHVQEDLIKEQNKKKLELLRAAIIERQKDGNLEPRLPEIQRDLDELDQFLNIDVSIMKEQIEETNSECQQAQKHYERARKETLEAKAMLQKKSELKQSMEQHMDIFIHQNEVWRACKLTELMKKLSLEEGSDLIKADIVEALPKVNQPAPVQDSTILTSMHQIIDGSSTVSDSKVASDQEVSSSATNSEVTSSANDPEATSTAPNSEVIGFATNPEMTSSATDKEVANGKTDSELTDSAADPKQDCQQS